jgi:hypothetical protein
MTKTVGATSSLASLALLGLLLAGCVGTSAKSAAPAGSPSSSGHTSTAASNTAPASSSAPAFASTSAGTPAGPLSKPNFLIAMNALCSAVDAQRQALPTPTSATDYPAITTNLTGTLRLLPVFISHAETLIAKSVDRAALERNWLAIERADFAVVKPIAQRTVADSNARNAAKVQADLEALDAAPNHSSTLAAYLRDYGLASCASLESH